MYDFRSASFDLAVQGDQLLGTGRGGFYSEPEFAPLQRVHLTDDGDTNGIAVFPGNVVPFGVETSARPAFASDGPVLILTLRQSSMCPSGTQFVAAVDATAGRGPIRKTTIIGAGSEGTIDLRPLFPAYNPAISSTLVVRSLTVTAATAGCRVREEITFPNLSIARTSATTYKTTTDVERPLLQALYIPASASRG
jgi:hypothetical protein